MVDGTRSRETLRENGPLHVAPFLNRLVNCGTYILRLTETTLEGSARVNRVRKLLNLKP